MIVCEVGLNHLGNEEYSTMYMEKLSKSKCDAISYQIREPKFYAKDKYKDYELSFDHYQGLIKSTDKIIYYIDDGQHRVSILKHKIKEGNIKCLILPIYV